MIPSESFSITELLTCQVILNLQNGHANKQTTYYLSTKDITPSIMILVHPLQAAHIKAVILSISASIDTQRRAVLTDKLVTEKYYFILVPQLVLVD